MKARERRVWEVMSLSLVLGLAAAIGALVFLAWLSDEVLRGKTRSFDTVTRDEVHKLASPLLTRLMEGISFLGSTQFLFTATTIVVLLFVWLHWKREAILLAITMGGAALLNTTLKVSFQRPRPTPFFDLVAPHTYSFPSGHALASFCFYGALAAILMTRAKAERTRLIIWIGAAILVLVIGLSRIYLGVHYTTDVFAGYAAALIWVLVVNFVEHQLANRRNKKSMAGTQNFDT